MKRIKRLFFDIETSPNIGFFWQSGYKLQIPYQNIIKERAIICICYKWEGNKTVHSLTWDKDQNDRTMLEAFIKEVNKADEMIGHNGDKFDLKWIKTRAVFHGLEVSPYLITQDTLKIARKHFRFNSNRLDYLGQFLKVGKKMDTGGFELWVDIVLNKSKSSMKKMVDYCKEDVALLERVWDKLSTFEKPRTSISIYRCDCPECGSRAGIKNGLRVTTAGHRSVRLRCKDCGKNWQVPENTYIKQKNLQSINDERTKK